jgi:hypothetical protein
MYCSYCQRLPELTVCSTASSWLLLRALSVHVILALRPSLLHVRACAQAATDAVCLLSRLCFLELSHLLCVQTHARLVKCCILRTDNCRTVHLLLLLLQLPPEPFGAA